MLISLRPALSAGCLFLPRSSLNSHHFSHYCTFSRCNSVWKAPSFGTHGASSLSSLEFLRGIRRALSTGTKLDIGPSVKASALLQMEEAMAAVSRKVAYLRGFPPSTGKIRLPRSQILYTVNRSPHIDKKSREQFEMIIKKEFWVIEAEPHELRKKLFWLIRQKFPSIETSGVKMPRLSKEHMKALAKCGEDAKQNIGSAHERALEAINKSRSSILEADLNRLEKEVDEMAKKFVKSAEDMCKLQKDISEA